MDRLRIFINFLALLAAVIGITDAVYDRWYSDVSIIDNAAMQTALLFLILGVNIDTWFRRKQSVQS